MNLYRSLLTGLLGFCYSMNVIAGISLDSSRIVFHDSNAVQGVSIGVTSSAQSTAPYLVKAQILGNIQGTQTQNVFSVTPSLFRLEPDSTNQLRILKTGTQPLPQEKESIFYLRVIGLPARINGNIENNMNIGGTITVSTGSVIKVFYRPKGLAMTQQTAMSSLRFSRQAHQLKISNPTPYFITLSSLTIGNKAIAMSVREQNMMIAPFSHLTYSSNTISKNVTWKAINDYGEIEVFHGEIK